MSEDVDPDRQDVAILARAVENVFRKLIRFLVGRISLAKLQEMIGFIYVQEAENRLTAECPGKSVPMTKIALMTGLDSRAVANIRKHTRANADRYQQQFLQDLTPESAIVEAWAKKIELAAETAADAKQLKYGGHDSGFEALVRSTISSRGITTQTIIQRLEATGSVAHDRHEKTLTLLTSHFSPYLSHHEPNIINAAFSAVSNLISTIEHNVKASAEEKFFQRQLWTFRLARSDQIRFRQEIRKFLEAAEGEGKILIAPWEAKDYSPHALSAGMGFYYFEDGGERRDGAPGRI